VRSASWRNPTDEILRRRHIQRWAAVYRAEAPAGCLYTVAGAEADGDAVNHDESIAILLDAVAEKPRRARPTPDQRRQAEDHLSRCSDCCRVLSGLHERATGERLADTDRIMELFGCERVQDEMHLLVGLSPSRMAAEHPHLARHLGWCHACRDRFAQVLQVEDAAARGEFGPARARWREAVGALGETIRELVGQAVVQVRKGVAVFTVAPEGLLLSPALAPAAAWRGAPAASEPASLPLLGSRAQIALGDSGLTAELALHAQGADRVGLEVTVSGAEHGPLAASLRTVGAERTELVASQPARAGKPVAFGGLVPGRYVLDIHETPRDLRFRVGFEVASPPASG